MRALVLLALALGPASTSAQPAGVARVDVFLSALGESWAGVGAALPPPDAGTVTRGSGRLMWSPNDPTLKQIGLVVERGRVVRVMAQPLGGRGGFTAGDFREMLFLRLGEPPTDGFYRWAHLGTFYGEAVRDDLFSTPVDLAVEADQPFVVFRRAVGG